MLKAIAERNSDLVRIKIIHKCINVLHKSQISYIENESTLKLKLLSL